MGLYDFIYNLQRKSYRTRQRVLVGLVTVSFLILAVFWVFTFKNQMKEGLGVSENTESGKILGENQKLLSPVAALIDGFKNFKNDIAQKIGEYNGNQTENVRPVYQLPIE